MKMWMKMKLFASLFGGHWLDHARSIHQDLEGEHYGWTTQRAGRLRSLWYWIVAHHEVWCRIHWRPWVCERFGHVWEHEESDSAEVGFWCESWCARCGHSSGRRWM
jgi:hypothetical protein